MDRSSRGPRWRRHAPWLALALSLGLVLFAAVALLPDWEGDLTHYKYWTHLIAERGIAGAYSGTWPETYAVYPPVPLYLYKATGSLYRLTADPAFDLTRALDSAYLTWLLRLLGVVAHLALSLIIWVVVARWFGERRAWLSMLGYLFNPAVIFDVGYWGQPDPLHSLLTLLTLLAFGAAGRSPARLGALGGALAALALLTKPQVWVMAPLFGVVALWCGGWLAVLAAVGVGSLVAVLVCLPFILAGTTEQLLTFPDAIGSVMPVVSAQTHNLWWLVTGGGGMEVVDTRGLPFAASISYRQLGLGLLAISYLWTLWCLLRGPRGPRSALMAGAFLAFGFTQVVTRVHANHPFYALVLLAPLIFAARPGRWLFGVLSTTLFINEAWHDVGVASVLPLYLPAEAIYWVPILNSVANTVLLVMWAVSLPTLLRQAGGHELPAAPVETLVVIRPRARPQSAAPLRGADGA